MMHEDADAMPMLDAEFRLGERGQASLVMACFGYPVASDPTAALQESRLPLEDVLTCA